MYKISLQRKVISRSGAINGQKDEGIPRVVFSRRTLLRQISLTIVLVINKQK